MQKKFGMMKFNDKAYKNDPNIKKMQDLINKFDKVISTADYKE